MAVVLLASSGAAAFPSYVTTRYGLPELPSSYVNADCDDCHVGGMSGGSATGPHPWAPALNVFGSAYRSAGWNNALRDADSDGDGTSNGAELGAAGSAGFPAGAVGCDARLCAATPGAFVPCTGSFVACRATRIAGPASAGLNPTSNGYTFAFSCSPGTGPSPIAADTNWNDRCLNINECAPNPCGVGSCAQRAIAGWTAPGYDCTCPAGYLANGTTCQLVDACLAGTHVCTQTATCVDSPGNSSAFTCQCPAGSQGDGRVGGTGCTNVNECSTMPGVCDAGVCEDRTPGYACTCPIGFMFDGTTCVRGSLCTTSVADCVPLAICMASALPPGFTCACPAGYSGDGRDGGSGCANVDECAATSSPCSGANTQCVDFPGTFSCRCAPGFEGDGGSCADVDECDAGLFGCSPQERCVNLVGSSSCECVDGFIRDAGTCVAWPSDAGVDGGTDAGLADAGVDAGVDAGAVGPDAGVVTLDAGEAPDSGTDAGRPTTDAGEQQADAGTTASDGGDPGPASPGCGCSEAPVASVLLMLTLLARRRRRTPRAG